MMSMYSLLWNNADFCTKSWQCYSMQYVSHSMCHTLQETDIQHGEMNLSWK